MKINNWIEKLKEKEKIKASNNFFLKKRELYFEFTLLFINISNINEKLKKQISTQKRRITRQTNEQNKENKTNMVAFDNIFKRLDKLEKKIFIKGK